MGIHLNEMDNSGIEKLDPLLLICDNCGKPLNLDKYVRYQLASAIDETLLCLQCWDTSIEAAKERIYAKSIIKPMVVRDGLVENYYPPREELAHKVMAYLNDRQEYHFRVFDCGELGILAMWMRNTWQCEWYNPEPLPDSLYEEKEAV